jgi:hypothetical protein
VDRARPAIASPENRLGSDAARVGSRLDGVAPQKMHLLRAASTCRASIGPRAASGGRLVTLHLNDERHQRSR